VIEGDIKPPLEWHTNEFSYLLKLAAYQNPAPAKRIDSFQRLASVLVTKRRFDEWSVVVRSKGFLDSWSNVWTGIDDIM
jgi:hypothetical protein